MGAAISEELLFELAGAGVSVQYRTDGDSVQDLELEVYGKRYAFDGDRIVKQGAKVGSDNRGEDSGPRHPRGPLLPSGH